MGVAFSEMNEGQNTWIHTIIEQIKIVLMGDIKPIRPLSLKVYELNTITWDNLLNILANYDIDNAPHNVDFEVSPQLLRVAKQFISLQILAQNNSQLRQDNDWINKIKTILQINEKLDAYIWLPPTPEKEELKEEIKMLFIALFTPQKKTFEKLVRPSKKPLPL